MYASKIEKKLVYDAKQQLLFQQDLGQLGKKKIELTHKEGDIFYGITGYDAREDSSQGILRTGGYTVEAGSQGNAGAPFVWTTGGYGILVDSDGGRFSIDKKKVRFRRGSTEDIEYYLVIGKPKDILAGVSAVSGSAPMFPKWAMGFTNSEWGIDEKFPKGSTGELKKSMDAKGMKLTGIMKPRLHVDTVQGQYAEQNGFWWPKESYEDYFSKKEVKDLDFSIKECRDWFFQHSKNAFDTGIVGWWNDEADEGYDNMQFMNMQKAFYEGQRGYVDQRVWSINRNFYLGAQRYAYGMWSGDIQTGFESMANQRERMLSAINLGQAKWGMDIGGFYGIPTEENYARWMQFGAFTPMFRVHGVNKVQRQPWIYGEKGEKVAKDVIMLRYKLIPYIYAYEREAYESGMGSVRPLIYAYPEDLRVANTIDSWMFGEYLLVSPIVKSMQTNKTIYLPEGTWIDYFKGTVYKGGQEIQYEINRESLEDIPLFIKQGAIIPSQDVMNYVGEKPVTTVYVDVFPEDKESTFMYYDDDGNTYNYEKGEYFIQKLSTQKQGKSVSFKVGEKQGSYRPETKYYMVKIHGIAAKSVTSHKGAMKAVKDFDTLMGIDQEGYTVAKDLYGDVTYIKLQAAQVQDILVN